MLLNLYSGIVTFVSLYVSETIYFKVKKKPTTLVLVMKKQLYIMFLCMTQSDLKLFTR